MVNCAELFTQDGDNNADRIVYRPNRYVERNCKRQHDFCWRKVKNPILGGVRLIRYPATVATQQFVLAPLQAITSQNTFCEAWISLLVDVNNVYSSLSTADLQNLSTIAKCVANVLDYLYANNTQSIFSSQYLLQLSLSARQVSSSAALIASIATGTTNIIILTQSALTALFTLQAWDPVQGYQAPTNPSQLMNTVIGGTSIQ